MEVDQHDILVVPDNISLPENFPHQYHKMKYLHTPSIVMTNHNRGLMNTITTNYLKQLLGIEKPLVKDTTIMPGKGKDIFFRHIRILNKLTKEYYNNQGASVFVDLRAEEGRFFFSYSICGKFDNFNKMIANRLCEQRMKNVVMVEVINYDPEISILQNIFLAIGVLVGEYPISEYDWSGILPEVYGTFTPVQLESLRKLRRLIKLKAI
jgi:hypothetical protein